MILNENLINRR